jgi:uncharacterized coiled-coil protein SlyX
MTQEEIRVYNLAKLADAHQETATANQLAITFATIMTYGVVYPTTVDEPLPDGTPLTSVLVLNEGDSPENGFYVINMKGKTTSYQTFCELKKLIQEMLDDVYKFGALFLDENSFNEWCTAIEKKWDAEERYELDSLLYFQSKHVYKLKDSIAQAQQELAKEEKELAAIVNFWNEAYPNEKVNS